MKRNRWRWCENIIDIIFTALAKQALSEVSCYFASGLAWLILSRSRAGMSGVKLLTHSLHTCWCWVVTGSGHAEERHRVNWSNTAALHGNYCSFT